MLGLSKRNIEKVYSQKGLKPKNIILTRHDIERILDEVIFIDNGEVKLHETTDDLRVKEKASIDEIFRRMFKC